MYSGLTLTRYSGRLFGGHQKVDSVARRHLAELLSPKSTFPGIRSILHFEGKNGPDGIKRKSPSKNEPWHFFEPLKGDTTAFMRLIEQHHDQLIVELKAKNKERSAFEAAWFAHTIVDGLTPAHQYPYEEKMAEIRGGAAKDDRTTVMQKWIFKGDTKSKTFKNIVKVWGPRGLFIAHGMFELGFGFIIKPLRFPDARPSPNEIRLAKKVGYHEYYLRQARKVARMKMFDTYIKDGWTSKLSRQVRESLAPTIVRTITVLWYLAAEEAGVSK
jgi:hypothetical protein